MTNDEIIANLANRLPNANEEDREIYATAIYAIIKYTKLNEAIIGIKQDINKEMSYLYNISGHRSCLNIIDKYLENI